MYLTEEEAEAVWCPWARVYGGRESEGGRWGTVASVNRGNDEDWERLNTNCLASNCAAWRWSEHCRHPGGKAGDDPWHIPARECPGWRRLGYCGRVGKPE